MRALIFSLFALTFSGAARGEPLTAADRELLLGNLDKLQNSVNEKVDDRFRSAMTDFRAAMGSDSAAFELYMKCAEKVEFSDVNGRNVDFREWRRRHDRRHSDPAFKLALRHQLRWLVLTLQASSETADRDALAAEGQQILDGIFKQAPDLSGGQDVLAENVISTYFARAYDLSSLNVEDWTMSPIQRTGRGNDAVANVEATYERVLIPPLIKPERIAALRTAWTKRIEHEGLARQYFHGDGRQESREPTSSPVYIRFLSDVRPQLEWKMEVDLFKAGDERGAAKRMLEMIEKSAAHPRTREWAEEFKNLLATPAAIGAR